jgi:serine/threonine protein kinase
VRDEKKMFDPTQTQPLSWRMHQGRPIPAEDMPVDPPERQAPTFDDDGPPDRLSDYRLRARVGGGRLGPIYEAQDELSRISGSQHFVAIQLIDERIASRPGFADEFERGGAALKSLSHPNLVRLLEYGQDRGRFYLVNELLESASLRFVLSDAGSLPSAETTAVLRAVGDALQYLHAKGMVHGNLRPENVLVTFGYEVKVLDIVPNGWIVNPNDALGVPARAPDKRDDVFGIACLAYEMLSGRHPYNGNTAQEAYREGLEPERLQNVTDRQWRALAGALAVHRDDRTPNVQQFLDELGVRTSHKLKAVVTTPNVPVVDEPVPQPTYTAPEPPPALARPVYAERAAREAPERRGVFGKLLAVLVVLGLAYAAWYYQEPLRSFSSDLMSEVETRVASERAPPARAAPSATSADAPLKSEPTVTDPEPATVLAPGAKLPERAATTTTAPDEPVSAPRPVPAPVPSRQRETTEAPQRQAAVTPRPQDTPPTRREPPVAQTQPRPAPSAVIERAPPVRETPVQGAPVPEQAPATAPTNSATPAVAAAPSRFVFQQGVVTVREGDVAARIAIRRSGGLSESASVSWWTEQGTARADADYADLGARIETFAPGEASRTIYVPLTNDAVREPPKSFRVLLGRGGGSEASSETRVDLIDDD